MIDAFVDRSVSTATYWCLMPNLLEQLENNEEAVLLMYIAGELPDEDRAEVAQMLSTDRRLRDELEQLRATVADANAMVGAQTARRGCRSPSRSRCATRCGAMRQYRLTHPYREALAAVDKGLRYPWWTYPSSAAAMLLLSAAGLVGYAGDSYLDGSLADKRNAPTWPATDPGNTFTGEEERPMYAQVDDLDRASMELRNLADGL